MWRYKVIKYLYYFLLVNLIFIKISKTFQIFLFSLTGGGGTSLEGLWHLKGVQPIWRLLKEIP